MRNEKSEMKNSFSSPQSERRHTSLNLNLAPTVPIPLRQLVDARSLFITSNSAREYVAQSAQTLRSNSQLEQFLLYVSIHFHCRCDEKRKPLWLGIGNIRQVRTLVVDSAHRAGNTGERFSNFARALSNRFTIIRLVLKVADSHHEVRSASLDIPLNSIPNYSNGQDV